MMYRRSPVYFHRISRTARKGEDGTAITLVSYGEMSNFNSIKAMTKTHRGNQTSKSSRRLADPGLLLIPF